MGFLIFLILVVALGIALLFAYASVVQARERDIVAGLTPDQRKARRCQQEEAIRTMQFGRLRPQVICPHCLTRGTVRLRSATKKAGISGGKATVAVLTGGVSLLATGLSRKESFSSAHCDFCNSTWPF